MHNLDDLIKTCGAFICHAQVHRKDCFWAVKCNECNLSTNYKLDPYSSIAAWNKRVLRMDKLTMHRTALWIQERADQMRDDLKKDYAFMGKNHDPNSYGTGFDKGYLEALQDISEEIWLRMNDEEVT